jgi:hypothetical protein
VVLERVTDVSCARCAPACDAGPLDDEAELKRRKRLEMNRKAARESRRRKKLRIEELQRSVVFLTRENNELREQNELLRQMLAAQIPTDNAALDRFQAENAAALKYEAALHAWPPRAPRA